MKKILVTYKIPIEGLQELISKYDVTLPEKEFLSENEISDIIHAYDAVLTVFTKKFGRELILKGKKLKIISNYGVGFNNIDVETASANKIVVANTPDVVTEPTAEVAFGLMLSVAHRISEMDRKLRTKDVLSWGIMENLGTNLYEKTLGIVGFGKIGQSIARRAVASGMKIIYFSRNRVGKKIEQKYSAKYTAFNKLLATSDFVSLHTPLTNETHHLIGKNELELMKPEAFIINTARGPVINEKALVEALTLKTIAGAGLDVFENEPEIEPQLLKLDNVVIVPHIGTATKDTRIETSEAAARNIINFFEKSGEVSIVNPHALDN